MNAKELLNYVLNRGPNRKIQVTVWLGSQENWGGNNRRFVGLLTQAEIVKAQEN